ncbi:hypothetical protein SAMN04489712_13228 [Thermomonospora echinospora]|uniref:Uncharacterized protein n=1 Tax=Thermomonospora echinospora TaxID=1992 RepID=A0A1H6E3A7_9ACTN|nr:hypothetical protein SAMN04489712_13228 [Thermomonospora echinospora]
MVTPAFTPTTQERVVTPTFRALGMRRPHRPPRPGTRRPPRHLPHRLLLHHRPRRDVLPERRMLPRRRPRPSRLHLRLRDGTRRPALRLRVRPQHHRSPDQQPGDGQGPDEQRRPPRGREPSLIHTFRMPTCHGTEAYRRPSSRNSLRPHLRHPAAVTGHMTPRSPAAGPQPSPPAPVRPCDRSQSSDSAPDPPVLVRCRAHDCRKFRARGHATAGTHARSPCPPDAESPPKSSRAPRTRASRQCDGSPPAPGHSPRARTARVPGPDPHGRWKHRWPGPSGTGLSERTLQ